jgi:ssDNA-binding Zn-finger/Zn-ribbon topoisomerase 1
MSLRIRQRPRHGYTFDFATPCPQCGYIIQPEELELTGFSKMRCPKCRKEFETKESPNCSIGLRHGTDPPKQP